MKEKKYDAIVVGGGPGGATAATFITLAGHKVLLLEKEQFPRHQIGESLLPATIQGICTLLGVKDKVDAASFIPKKGGTFLWGKSKEPWTFNFESSPPGVEPKATAYQVERSKFDEILLNNAIDKGVEVNQNAQVLNVLKEAERVTGVEYKDKNGNILKATAKFVVDASGHRSPIYEHVGKRVYSNFFRNIATYGYFVGGKRIPHPNHNNILSVAFKYGWIWYIPLSAELTSVGVVVDKETIGLSKDIEETYYKHLNSSPIITDYLSDATRSTDPLYSDLRTRKDFSYSTTKLWAPGMVLVGDAACFVDPLFSSGVHLATLSALYAARSINTSLKNNLDETICFQEYEMRYRKEYGNFYNFLLAFYNFDQSEEEYYWSARKILNTQEKGNEAFIKLVSGYSTQGIVSQNTFENFFSDRINLGTVFQSHLSNEINIKKDIASNIDIPAFMQGFNQEIINLQALALGHNLERIQKNNQSLIPSEDAIHWCRL